MNRHVFLASSLMVLLGMHYNTAAAENKMTQVVSEFALNATYKVDTVWATAYQVTVTLTNNTSISTGSWAATFSVPQGYELSSHVSGGNFKVQGQNVVISNLSGAGVIKAGKSTTFQMIINMPLSGQTIINNLQAIANGSITPPPSVPIPTAPSLNVIKPLTSQSYTVSWQSVANVASYTLQQDISSSFSNPIVVAQGTVLSKIFTNATPGTYFYRVTATNTSGTSPYSNTQSITIAPPNVPIPAAPTLSPITGNSDQGYTVSWNSVQYATSYSLQQDVTSSFSNPAVVAQGNTVSKTFTNVAPGTYFYRVSATDASGTSPFSNLQSITLPQTPPPPVNTSIEHSAWYIDWTSWFNGPPFVIPSNVNLLNVFVGTLMFDGSGNPTVGGFGNMTLPQLDAFTSYCNKQVPPIKVKVSIGGGGGMYDRCWDLLTAVNVPAFAQGMVDFCHTHGLAGVDFDYEEFASSTQEALVGTLIKNFKTIDPGLQTSLCTNAGFGPNFPWQQAVKNILDAATIAPGNCAVDRLYIMSYYNSMQEEEDWIVGPDGNGGWANWVITNYGFTPARVSVGIDDFDAHAYDPVAFAEWAASKGFSTGHWAFDPARP